MAAEQILVVEDEPIVALNLQNRLQGLGYVVSGVASSADEAVEKAGKSRPDLVLMDIRLKGDHDGIHAAEVLRSLHNLPVVYLTAYADDETLSRARATTPAGYLLKPFETKELQATIEIALQRHKMEKKLRESEERYALASHGANDGIWDWNLLTNQVYFSPRWKAMLGLAETDVGTDPKDWFGRLHAEDLDRFKRDLSRHLDAITPSLENEYRILHADGSYRWVFCRGVAVRDAGGRPYRLAGSQADVTRRRVAEERLIQFAFFDPLTDLPNRVAFVDRLWSTVRHRLVSEENVSSGLAVVYIRIRGFEPLAAAMGPLVANSIVDQAAKRMEKATRTGDTLARLDGCDFGALLHSTDGAGVQTYCDSITQAFDQPFLAGNMEIFGSPAFGFAFSSPSHNRPEDVMREASAALSEAAERNSPVEHSHTVGKGSSDELEAVSRMNRAFSRGEFEVHYQPIVRLEDGRVTTVEAFVRWRDPVWGVLLPDEIFQVAQKAGMVRRLERQTARMAVQWFKQNAVDKHCSLALNVFPQNIPDFADAVYELALEEDVDASRLILHLSSSCSSLIHKNLWRGPLRFCCDAGLSPLMFRDADPAVLGIDVMGVNLAIPSAETAAIRSIVALAREAGWQVTAKRVEGRDQIPALRQAGFTEAQGFAFERPLPADQAVRLVSGVGYPFP